MTALAPKQASGGNNEPAPSFAKLTTVVVYDHRRLQRHHGANLLWRDSRADERLPWFVCSAGQRVPRPALRGNRASADDCSVTVSVLGCRLVFPGRAYVPTARTAQSAGRRGGPECLPMRSSSMRSTREDVRTWLSLGRRRRASGPALAGDLELAHFQRADLALLGAEPTNHGIGNRKPTDGESANR